MGFRLDHAACAAIIGLALTAAAPARADDPVIANLGTQPVKASDIKDFLPALNPAQREQAAKDSKIMAQIVRAAIGRKLALEQAVKDGWDKKPDVAAQIERYREEVIVATYLQSVAALPADYPSDDDVRQAYAANREKFNIPPQYHLSQIFIAEPADATKEAAAAAAAKARTLAKQARAKGADFAELARANSEDTTSAAKGGDLGWLGESQIVPDILVAIKMNGGKGVTEPVHGAGGWHILWVMATKPASTPSLEQVRGTLVTALRDTRINQAEQAYLAKTVDDNHVTVNETAAASLFAAAK